MLIIARIVISIMYYIMPISGPPAMNRSSHARSAGATGAAAVGKKNIHGVGGILLKYEYFPYFFRK